MGLGKVFERFGAVAWFAPLPAQRIVDEVSRDAAKPAAQFFSFAQGGELFPGGDECFLSEVFACGEAARGAVSQGADELLIAQNNLAKVQAMVRQRSASP